MTTPSPCADDPALARLARRFERLPWTCGRPQAPGIVETGDWFDWSAHETTPDQRRIEQYVERFDLSSSDILHVGSGNSSLALRLADRARWIIATTLSPLEVRIGNDLRLPNYTVRVANKFDGAMPDCLDRFDFIVDNNPTTYACCLTHLLSMLRGYAASLRDGGSLVTDKVGLAWSLDPQTNSVSWGLSVEEFAAIAAEAGLAVSQDGPTIVLATRGKPRPLSLRERVGWMLRRGRRALRRRLRPQPSPPAIAP